MSDLFYTKGNPLSETLAFYASSSPKLFFMLTDCMSLQPDIDPEASGPFWPVELYERFVSQLEDGTNAEKLCAQCDYNPRLFYLFLRAYSYMYWALEGPENSIATGQLDWHKMREHVLSYSPNFKITLADKGNQHGNTQAHSGQRPQGV